MNFYDSGMLIALERGDRRAWLRFRRARSKGVSPVVPAPVLAQTWRGGPSVGLSRALQGCDIVPFGVNDSKAVGELCAAAGRSDVVDAHLAYLARRPRSVIVTSDVGDLAALIDGGGYPTEVIPV